MRTEDFDFPLPEERIALAPVSPRDAARMLVVRGTDRPFEDRTVRDLPDVLRPGDLLVVNETRVIPAALQGLRPAREAGGASGPVAIELNLHQRVGEAEWRAFARPAKRLRPGDAIRFADVLTARVLDKTDTGEIGLSFDRSGPDLDRAIEEVGKTPLPPYILSKRGVNAADAQDYQTVYGREAGSVAAPTAGLHFTDDLMQRLEARGVRFCKVLLHVSAGTFLPVKTDDPREHRMHSEWRQISPEAAAAINAAKAEGRRVIAVGTTSLRSLESAVGPDGRVEAVSGETDIFITPGYRFGVVDALMTNFHLPKSTLFMLVSALMGRERMLDAYAHAIAQEYRFYSYGDASLLLPHG